jgi:predicted protein tyrosine phosphatase
VLSNAKTVAWMQTDRMAVAVTFPGPLVIRGAGASDQDVATPDWGVYADPCWCGWPGIVLDWPDFGLPLDDEQAVVAILNAVDRARSGQDILVACRGGIGRTGTLMASVAVATGVPPERARAWVRARYHPDAVETDAQHMWVKSRVALDDRIAMRAETTRNARVKTIADRLRTEMTAALHADDPLPRLAWAVPDVLAITQRPLRAHPTYGGSRRDYPREARPDVDAWIADLVRQGIRSVIVLTSSKELCHYDDATLGDGGLLNLYRRAGLKVVHFPADDPAHNLTARAAFDAAVDHLSIEVASALRSLPGPAAMHCSAAIDRSPPVAARIAFLSEVDGL